MRSNRPNYASTPAGSAKAFDQKPKPKRSKREINQLMLMLFFIVLPVLGLLAIFFQPIRWVFMLAVVAAVAAMWVIHAFLFPGRMILTAVYGLLTVFTLINALTASRTSSIRPAQTLLVPTPVPAATDVPFASYGTMGTSVPEEYYGGMTADDGSVDGLTETGFSGGSDDGSVDSGLYDESGTDENAPYVATVKSEAEIALEVAQGHRGRHGGIHREELAGFPERPAQPAALLEIRAEAAAGLAADGRADGHGREQRAHDLHSGRCELRRQGAHVSV